MGVDKTVAKKATNESKSKKTTPRRNTKSSKLRVYSNLTHKRRTKKDAAAKKHAEYLASLPKHPVKRFFYRLHPKRVARYWFSKRGFFMAIKILGVMLLLMLLTIGGLFAYFRKDLDQIRPSELAKRVQTTVTTYYDRNGKTLWEDKGDGNYKLVVESDEISQYMKDATVAIEDRDFYKHHGVSPSGILRAFVNNTTSSSGNVQGGSTLTQQLVKQVFFADEASERGLAGIPRKIKEAILAIEVERMYDKDQILTLYLNESPYGGPRNGVESAAQAYFGKSAKDLTLAESALLAAIPQNPSLYNPYVVNGNQALIARQQTILQYMADEGYVTQEEADDAMKVAILDKLKPLPTQFANIKAPHFVLMVRQQLIEELGATTVGQGGLSVKTTLDLRIQNKLESEMKSFFDSGAPASVNISNGAATVEDAKTGQIVALMGSRDFNYAGFGQDNATDAYIQPGSTVKPFVYAKLFENKGSNNRNYGSGTIIPDKNIDSIYGASLNNWDGRFMGNLTIRKSLALSRNTPAAQAMYISGIEPTLQLIRDSGAVSYCEQEESAGLGLSSAIGGCGVKQIDLTNAYATLAREGVYKPASTILEVKNVSGDVIKKWEDTSKRVMDKQVAYIVNDILGDLGESLHGAYGPGMYVPGVKTAAKTGTSDRDRDPKDLWIATYTPALAMTLWLGNSDTSNVWTSRATYGGVVVTNTLEYAHKQIYAKEKKWSEGDWFKRPDGIQSQGKELYPSWWNKSQGQSNEKLTFDRVSKYKATRCTPAGAKIEVEVIKTTDPITKKDIYIAPDGYDASKEDDKHKCGDAEPSVSLEFADDGTSVTVSYVRGTFALSKVTISQSGGVNTSFSVGGSGSRVIPLTSDATVTAAVVDAGYYESSASGTPPED